MFVKELISQGLSAALNLTTVAQVSLCTAASIMGTVTVINTQSPSEAVVSSIEMQMEQITKQDPATQRSEKLGRSVASLYSEAPTQQYLRPIGAPSLIDPGAVIVATTVNPFPNQSHREDPRVASLGNTSSFFAAPSMSNKRAKKSGSTNKSQSKSSVSASKNAASSSQEGVVVSKTAALPEASVDIASIESATAEESAEVAAIAPKNKYNWRPYSEWGQRVKVYLNAHETVANFPILVTLKASEFEFNNFAEKGLDIRFTTDHPTKPQELAYEIDEWNVDGVSRLWVKVPKIKEKESFIWMYYNNALATLDTTVSHEVWENTEEIDCSDETKRAQGLVDEVNKIGGSTEVWVKGRFATRDEVRSENLDWLYLNFGEKIKESNEKVKERQVAERFMDFAEGIEDLVENRGQDRNPALIDEISERRIARDKENSDKKKESLAESKKEARGLKRDIKDIENLLKDKDLRLAQIKEEKEKKKNEISQGKQRIESLQKEVAEKQTEIEKSQADMEKKQSMIDQRSSEISKKNDKIKEKRAHVARLKAEISDKKTKIKGVKGEIEQKDIEIAKRNIKIKEAKDKMRRELVAYDKKKKSKEHQKEHQEDLEKDKIEKEFATTENGKKREIANFEKGIDEDKRKIKVIEDEVKEQDHKIIADQQDVSSIESEIAAINEKISEIEGETVTIKNNIIKMRESKRAVEDKVSQVKKHIASTEQDLIAYDSDFEIANQEISTTKERISELENQVKTVEQAIENLGGDSEEVVIEKGICEIAGGAISKIQFSQMSRNKKWVEEQARASKEGFVRFGKVQSRQALN